MPCHDALSKRFCEPGNRVALSQSTQRGCIRIAAPVSGADGMATDALKLDDAPPRFNLFRRGVRHQYRVASAFSRVSRRSRCFRAARNAERQKQDCDAFNHLRSLTPLALDGFDLDHADEKIFRPSPTEPMKTFTRRGQAKKGPYEL